MKYTRKITVRRPVDVEYMCVPSRTSRIERWYVKYENIEIDVEIEGDDYDHLSINYVKQLVRKCDDQIDKFNEFYKDEEERLQKLVEEKNEEERVKSTNNLIGKPEQVMFSEDNNKKKRWRWFK